MKPILIVEDNDKNLKLVRDILQFKGYATVEATTATDGLRLARKGLPVLILMDIQLPDFDGITALRELRSDARTSGIPVLAVSASAMPGDRQRIMANGFDGYITKPLDIKGLLSAVENLIGRPEGGDR